ncbi:MAG: hypothetical protein OXC44_05760 [Proteobacteria bacterium]|nr:hypothetical protein [Pseudomonadota bacterium]
MNSYIKLIYALALPLLLSTTTTGYGSTDTTTHIQDISSHTVITDTKTNAENNPSSIAFYPCSASDFDNVNNLDIKELEKLRNLDLHDMEIMEANSKWSFLPFLTLAVLVGSGGGYAIVSAAQTHSPTVIGIVFAFGAITGVWMGLVYRALNNKALKSSHDSTKLNSLASELSTQHQSSTEHHDSKDDLTVMFLDSHQSKQQLKASIDSSFYKAFCDS